MAERIDSSSKMGSMKVWKLLLDMGIPIMVSMLVQALYNVLDGIFVSRISESAFTAVSMAFPMQNLIIAFAAGNGVGINAVLSKALGSNDREKANRAVTNGIFLQGLSYLLFLLLGLFAIEAFMRSQTDNEEIFRYGVTYLRIILCLCFGGFGQVTAERLLQSTGRAKLSMVTQLSSAIFKLIADPVLIFGLMGFPALGVAGAASATVAGQCFGTLVGLWLNLKKNPEISLSFKGFRPDMNVIREMCKVSIPAIFMSAIYSITVYMLDIILKGFTSTAVAVLGAFFKLQSFVTMPAIGLSHAVVPIIAYNYGAKNRKRLSETVKFGILFASIFMIVGLLLMQLIPEKLLMLFDADENMMAIGVPALRIISIHFIFSGANMINSCCCQGFGYGNYSLIISFMRQIIGILPIAYLLSLTGNLTLVWLCYPIAEIISTSLSFPLLSRAMRRCGMKSGNKSLA